MPIVDISQTVGSQKHWHLDLLVRQAALPNPFVVSSLVVAMIPAGIIATTKKLIVEG